MKPPSPPRESDDKEETDSIRKRVEGGPVGGLNPRHWGANWDGPFLDTSIIHTWDCSCSDPPKNRKSKKKKKKIKADCLVGVF